MSSAAPKLFVDPVTGDLVTERDFELLAMYDAAVADKEGIARWEKWFDEQPEEFRQMIDEIGTSSRKRAVP